MLQFKIDKMRRLISLVLLIGCTSLTTASAQSKINPELFKQSWPAWWISAPGSSHDGFGVYHFRKDFDLSSVPASFVVHVSADNRYKLYVNGTFVGDGPAKGDLPHWRFETIDLSKYLKPGKNIIAAEVWNEGRYRAAALQSYQTAFILQTNDSSQSFINTNDKWKVLADKAYKPIPIDRKEAGNFYFAIGPGLHIDGSQYPWQWSELSYDETDWDQAKQIRHGVPRAGNTHDIYAGWQLVPRTIPALERSGEHFEKIVRNSGNSLEVNGFIDNKEVTIPSNSHVRLLLDQGYETTAFPILDVSKGKGSRIKVMYAEALVDSSGNKGNRNDISGKHIRGYYDTFLPSGNEHEKYETLWWRTYRYVEMDITTGDQPLVINNYYGLYTGYPFKENASFSSNDPRLKNIWSTGWRTVRLCSHETYMDCPYYEQMQYDGDTRIEGLVTSYVSGDAGLLRKAITLFNDSRLPDGLVQSRYPAHDEQIIPPFALFWVDMVHDYWMYTGDSTFVSQKLTPVRGVLEWFERHLNENGLLGYLPRWNFVDWSFKNGGVPAGGREGNSSILTLQYVYALQMAADLNEQLGRPETAQYYAGLASKLSDNVKKQCWDSSRKMLADTPEMKEFSQHANVMAILDGLYTGQQAKDLMKRIMNDTSLIQTTYYYRFYLFQALKKTGLEKEFFNELGPWYHMLDLGLTTFAEQPEPTRSDCHGWSSSPLYEYLTMVAGINPAESGFRQISIEPHPGTLTNIEASMLSPQGKIQLSWKKSGNLWSGQVTLPKNVSGSFTWHGKTIRLHPGNQKLEVRN